MDTLTSPGQLSNTVVQIQDYKDFDVSISGSFTGSVDLVRAKEANPSSWNTVEVFTEPAERTGHHGSMWFYRFRAGLDFNGSAIVFVG